MQTNLADFIRNTEEGKEAESILRKCVHCGFCTATCPTYQLLGDELDGPRGRIYLIKQVLEGVDPSSTTQLHLDRCLSCLSCESTCPSGVKYGRLLDIGRTVVESRVERPVLERSLRGLLRFVIPYKERFGLLLKIGQFFRPALPASLKASTPPKVQAGGWPKPRHDRKMLVLNGCAQPAIAPNINAAAARVLSRLGIELVSVNDGCCGALSHHMSANEEALDFMRGNIDVWWPHIEDGAEAIVMTASGCGVLVKEYGHILRNDSAYAEKAAAVSDMTRDLSEVLENEDLSGLKPDLSRRVAVHSPCSLQHGQKLPGGVQRILVGLGFSLTPVADSHLCCGSAGSYSILHPRIAGQLKKKKLSALESGQPDVIATANIGCLAHMQGDAAVPVVHWINLID